MKKLIVKSDTKEYSIPIWIIYKCMACLDTGKCWVDVDDCIKCKFCK